MPGPAGQHTLILQQERATKKVTGRVEPCGVWPLGQRSGLPARRSLCLRGLAVEPGFVAVVEVVVVTESAFEAG